MIAIMLSRNRFLWPTYPATSSTYLKPMEVKMKRFIFIRAYSVITLFILSMSCSEGKIGANDIQSIIRQVTSSTDKINGYLSVMGVTLDPKPAAIKDYENVCEWKMDYIKPDRFSITQRVIEKDGPVFDRWISIGNENYFQIGLWFKETQGLGKWRHDINNNLKLDKWLDLMAANDMNSGDFIECEGKKYLFLTFFPKKIPTSFIVFKQNPKSIKTEIWIDPASCYIVKACITAKTINETGGNVDLIIRQSFSNYNSANVIDRPEEYKDMSSGETIKLK